MWPYDSNETPPAPYLDLEVQHIEDPEQVLGVRAKIDTGADISAVPTSVIEQLDLPIVSRLVVEGFDGKQAIVSTYGAVLTIGNSRFRGQEFIETHEEHVLLGRDILNFLHLLLNGPELALQIQQTPFEIKTNPA